jgi:hypothetical protein
MSLYVLVGLAGCGGDTAFIPDPGAFSGNFSNGTAADIGDLSFTASQSGVAGTGVLHNGALDVDVAIDGNVSNGQITGHVTNAFLGSGTFKGKFQGTKAATGTFSFDIVTGTKLTGTWNAAAP